VNVSTNGGKPARDSKKQHQIQAQLELAWEQDVVVGELMEMLLFGILSREWDERSRERRFREIERSEGE